MQLSMQQAGGHAEDLPENDDVMSTGQMGDCFSIVVLWNYDLDTQTYRNVRGYHGWGGFQHVNLDSLFDGVPDGEGTLIYGFIGTTATASRDSNRFYEAISNLRPGAHVGAFETPDGQAHVHRNGELG